jgi:ubiquinone biosynthesis protein COQ9
MSGCRFPHQHGVKICYPDEVFVWAFDTFDVGQVFFAYYALRKALSCVYISLD